MEGNISANDNDYFNTFLSTPAKDDSGVNAPNRQQLIFLDDLASLTACSQNFPYLIYLSSQEPCESIFKRGTRDLERLNNFFELIE